MKKGGREVKVLYGTIEYFEREIQNYIAEHKLGGLDEEHLSIIKSKLETEILYDFVCDERLRSECLKNLSYVSDLVIA